MTVALTAFAICTLSCRIAIISWRLYRMTGHWPVVNDSDFAQPRPMRMRQRADLGGLVDAARVAGDVEARDADRAAGRG